MTSLSSNDFANRTEELSAIRAKFVRGFCQKGNVRRVEEWMQDLIVYRLILDVELSFHTCFQLQSFITIFVEVKVYLLHATENRQL